MFLNILKTERAGRGSNAPPTFILDDQIRRIRRDDAIFSGQFHDFVLQFRTGAPEPDLVEEIPDAPRGPKSRDELVIPKGFQIPDFGFQIAKFPVDS